MSHFTVMVVGEDVVSLMDPYSESYEQTPYRVNISVSPVELVRQAASAVDRIRNDAASPPMDDLMASVVQAFTTPEMEERRRRGQAEWAAQVEAALKVQDEVERTCLLYGLLEGPDIKHGGGGYYYMSTWNQQGEHDWWVVGGRWRGFFQLKPEVPVGLLNGGVVTSLLTGEGVADPAAVGAVPIEDATAVLGEPGSGEATAIIRGDFNGEVNYGGRADSALKRDIDFDAMRMFATLEGEHMLDAYDAAVGDLTAGTPWEDFRRRYTVTNVVTEATEEGVTTAEYEVVDFDTARREYRKEPWVAKLVEARLVGASDLHEVWCIDPVNGRPDREQFLWNAAGSAIATTAFLSERTGWVDVIESHERSTERIEHFMQLLDSVGDDERLTVVDCHV